MSWKAVMLLFVGILLSAGLVVAAIMALLFRASGGPVEAGDQVLQEIWNGNLARAYDLTAPAFRKDTSAEEFGRFVEQWRLTEAKSRTWHTRSVSGDAGFARATVRLDSEHKVPLVFEAEREGETWRVTVISIEVENYPLPIPPGTLVRIGRGGVVEKQ
ncbi:MAG: hypothetical protein D6724_09525 [Armatimonadetes bacterium]|jgi:hypothetical protein|nr:MAG: hypothetical protein D6724_09525 [Armatimonadota bacterium]GIV03204.1 MAG: hypothetical protein KatS3mg015_2034 [Fimbriimonadales bacterium]